MRDWRDEVSATVVELIERANGGHSPESLEDWARICERFQCELVVTDVGGRQRGCLLDDVLVVKRGRELEETCCRIAHELAEFLLVSNHAEPYVYAPSGRSADMERHLVARRVEARIVGKGGDSTAPVAQVAELLRLLQYWE